MSSDTEDHQGIVDSSGNNNGHDRTSIARQSLGTGTGTGRGTEETEITRPSNSLETTSRQQPTPQPDDDDVTILFDNSRGKKNCWGPLLRCAVAFGIRQVVVVGPTNRCNEKGSHGASKHVHIKAFPTVEAAVEFLSGYSLIGLLPYNPSRNSKEVSNNPKPIIHDDDDALPVEFDAVENVCYLQHQDQQSEQQPSRATNIEGSSVSRNERRRSLSFPACSRSFGTKNTRNDNDTGNERPGQNRGGTCFVVDRSTMGLPLKFANHCNGFIHIPHLGVDNEDQDNDTYDKNEEEVENDTREKTAENHDERSEGKLRLDETGCKNVEKKNKGEDNALDSVDSSRPSGLLVMEACLSIVLYEYKCWWAQQQQQSQQFSASTSTSVQNDNSKTLRSDEVDPCNIRTYIGQKYEVDQKMQRGFISLDERRQIQEERRHKKKQRMEEEKMVA
mmetsp:Transcript_54122/g.131346  ORF Transcript_54122/g.131346 Transcript_54122/m.131346 type:complete len:446 (+) Transcript_54122:64-1401(+)